MNVRNFLVPLVIAWGFTGHMSTVKPVMKPSDVSLFLATAEVR